MKTFYKDDFDWPELLVEEIQVQSATLYIEETLTKYWTLISYKG